nr:MAG TPA: hypothetical protein [Caudoviricetes sp.]
MTKEEKRKHNGDKNTTRLTSNRGIQRRRREKLRYLLKKYKYLNDTPEYNDIKALYNKLYEDIKFDKLVSYNGLFTKEEGRIMDSFGELINKYKNTWR